MSFVNSYISTYDRFVSELGDNVVLAEEDRNILQKVNTNYDLFLEALNSDNETEAMSRWEILLDLVNVPEDDDDRSRTYDYLRTQFLPQSLGPSATPTFEGVEIDGGNIEVTGTVDGRDVSTDGAIQDAHIADTTIHFAQTAINHLSILNIGSNTHAQIDSHISSTSNPHVVLATQITDFDTEVDNNSNVAANTTHRSSDGKDHSDVVLNNTHRGSDGKDHSDVVLNNAHRGSDGKDHSDVVLNNTHRGSDGSDHSFLDQAVTVTSTPTFIGIIVNGNIVITGTVDGRDVSVDGAKLDGIEALAKNNLGANSGTGTGVFKDITGSTLNFKSITTAGKLSISEAFDTITITDNDDGVLTIHSSSAAVDYSMASYKSFVHIPTENTTFNLPTNRSAGDTIVIEIRQGSTAYTIGWATGYLNGGDAVVDISTDANAYSLVTGYVDSNTNIVITSVKDIIQI